MNRREKRKKMAKNSTDKINENLKKLGNEIEKVRKEREKFEAKQLELQKNIAKLKGGIIEEEKKKVDDVKSADKMNQQGRSGINIKTEMTSDLNQTLKYPPEEITKKQFQFYEWIKERSKVDSFVKLEKNQNKYECVSFQLINESKINIATDQDIYNIDFKTLPLNIDKFFKIINCDNRSRNPKLAVFLFETSNDGIFPFFEFYQFIINNEVRSDSRILIIQIYNDSNEKIDFNSQFETMQIPTKTLFLRYVQKNFSNNNEISTITSLVNSWSIQIQKEEKMLEYLIFSKKTDQQLIDTLMEKFEKISLINLTKKIYIIILFSGAVGNTVVNKIKDLTPKNIKDKRDQDNNNNCPVFVIVRLYTDKLGAGDIEQNNFITKETSNKVFNLKFDKNSTENIFKIQDLNAIIEYIKSLKNVLSFAKQQNISIENCLI